LFPITVSHDKTPPARPAESRRVSYSPLLEGLGVKSPSTSARPIAATDQSKLGIVRICRRNQPTQSEVAPRRSGVPGYRSPF
jgi:hypothetical protein